MFAQIPLLMKIDSYDTALRKAIESGDSNLGKANSSYQSVNIVSHSY